MSSAFDVAEYILKQQGCMPAMKLQKLVYYCQAWSLVWDDRELFPERIEAWVNGPVVVDLYREHRGLFEIQPGLFEKKGSPDALDSAARETIDVVLKHYGDKNSQWLSDLTHAEPPWRDARKGLKQNERGTNPITPAAMSEYYSSLVDNS